MKVIRSEGKAQMFRNAQAHQADRSAAQQPARRTARSPAHDRSLARIVQQGQISPRSPSPQDVLALHRSIGNHAVGRLLAGASAAEPIAREVDREKGSWLATAGPVIQPVRLPVGGTIVETDYHDLDTLEQGMIYGVRGTARATTEEKGALQQEITERRKRGQYNAPGPKSKPEMPQKADFDRTMHRHEAGRDRLRAMVEQGLRSPDELLRNSCEWVKSGKAKLYAATDLEDTADRLLAAFGHNLEAYKQVRDLTLLYPDTKKVNQGDIYSEPEPYDWQAPLDDKGLERLMAKVMVESVATRGWHEGDKIAIVVDRLGSEQSLLAYFTETLKHEVQHSADLHEEQSTALGPRNKKNLLEHAKIEFETEYRAHSLMGHSEIVNASAEQKEKFIYDPTYTVSKRHNAVCRLVWKDIAFKYIPSREARDDDGPHLEETELKELFRYMATRDALAAGLNLLNSVRIDNFYQALQKHVDTGVVFASLELAPAERDYLKQKPGAVERIQALLKPGIGRWNDPKTLWTDLDRIRAIVLASVSLVQMYGWSRTYLVEQALSGKLDYLLDK